MDCSCVYVGDYDPPDFYVNSERKARKTHNCSECGGEITPGEIYEHISGKWGGQVGVFKTCSDCLSVQRAIFCDGIVHGGMWEFMVEHIMACDGEIKLEVLDQMTLAARVAVLDMIDQHWNNDGLWEDDEDPK